MREMNSKFRQWKYKMRHDYFSPENIVLLVAILFCLVWTYQSVVAMSRNWELAERLNTDKKSLELAKLEVEAAELENEYYESQEYQELAARRLANKQLPDEKMVYLPENSEAAINKHAKVAIEEAPEKEYSNIEKWFMYLFPAR